MNRFTRLTALLLAMLMIFSTFATAEGYQVGEMSQENWNQIVTDAKTILETPVIVEGEPKEPAPAQPGNTQPYQNTVAVQLGDNAEMSTADLAVVTAAQADQWQIAYTADVWVNIANENGATLNVNASMLQGTAMAVRQVKSDDVTTFTLNEASVSTAQSDAAAFTVESREGTTADEPLTIEEANPDVEANKFGLQINYVTQSGVAVASSYTASFVNGSSYTATVKHPEVKGYTPKLSTTSGTMGVTLAANNEDDKEVSVTYSFTNLTPNGTIKIKVVYEPIDVTYVVNHYQQKANDNEYTLHETETKYGKTESTTEAKAKTYDGFYALLFEQPEIAADGKTTVNIYYDRHYYLMQFVLGDGGYGVEPIYARYDADIGDVGAPTRPGYTFKGWTTDPNATVYTEGQTLVTPETTMPLNGATYYAVWEMGDSAKVKVVIWGENPNDEEYSYLTTGELMLTPNIEYTYNGTDQLYLYCEKEAHTHTEACGLTCGKEEHTQHTDDCLTCNIVSHSHGIDCWDVDGAAFSWSTSENYVKGTEKNGYIGESYNQIWGGILGEAATGNKYIYIAGTWYKYTGNAAVGSTVNPTCGKQEVTHDHTDSCYGCEVHSHADTCYGCGKEEHTHTMSGANACTGTVAGLDRNLWTFVKSDTVTVNPDGSTTINVYYDRVSYNVEFHSNQNCTNEYTNLRITAKWGQSILDKWPTYNGSSSWLVEGKSNTWQNSIQVMPVGGAKFWGPKSGDSSSTAYYYVEALPGATDTIEHNGVNYVLHHKDTSSSSGNVTSEDKYAIEGFTYKEGTANGSSYSDAKFYYTRHRYAIEYYSPTTLLKKTENVPYESPLADYDWKPEPSMAPDTYEPGSVEFAGWYLNPECTGEQFIFTSTDPVHTMPAGTNDGDTTLVVYAKWVPVERTVTFYIDRATMEDPNGEPMKIVTVPHGSKLTEEQIPTAEQAGYTFVGWFYIEDGKVNAFDFANMPVNRDLTVYAQWTSDTMVPYRVEYIYKAGDVTYKVAADTTGSALGGSTKTFEAKVGGELYEIYQTGYFPSLTRSHNIEMVINEVGGVVQEVVYTFEYFKRDAVPYVVYYVTEQQNDENPLDEVTINGKTYYQLLTPDVVDENDEAIVTEAFQVVNGYMPDAAQKSLVLNPEIGDSVAWLNINGVQVHPDNVIVFVYSEDATHAYYVYSYYIQELDGSYTLYAREDEQVGEVNETYNNKPLTTVPEGFEYARTDVCNAAGKQISSHTETTVSATLTNEGLEFKHYYDRVKKTYVVHYYEQGTTNEVYPDKQGEEKMYGWQVTEEAVDLEPAYRLVSTNEKSITISTTESENVIIFEYAENLVTIAYVPVGLVADKETGALTSSGETIKAITGTPTGSTAKEVSGYTFKGWYMDEACTIPVTTNDGTVTNTTFVPAKEAATENLPQGYYSDATFYALYTENTATITYQAVYKDADGNLYLDATGGTVDVPNNATPAGAKDSETVTVVTGAVAGATADPKDNYEFLGWFTKDDNGKYVAIEENGGELEYLPVQDGVWQDTTYYALFELDVADLTITKTVIGTTETDTFKFTVELTDANGNSLTGKFGITGANEVETIAHNGKFTLTVEPSVNTSTSVTIADLPIGTKYTVTETPKAGYTANALSESGTISTADGATAEFINTYSVGNLSITKNVEDGTETNGTNGDSFEFTVTLTAPANVVLADNYTVTGVTDAKYDKTKGIITFSLSNDQTAVITGIQVGVGYQVVETVDATKYTTKVDDVANTATSGTIAASGNAHVFTNTYTKGDLTISKTVSGAGGTFTFKVSLLDANGHAVSGTFEITGANVTTISHDGEFNLTVGKNGSASVTIKDLPAGTVCTVTETPVAGYETTVDGNDTLTGEATIVAGMVKNIAFTNTYSVEDLTITKEVVTDEDVTAPDDAFTITVKLTAAANAVLADSYTYTVKNADGTAGTGGTIAGSVGTITLKNGQTATISGLQIGTGYTVFETEKAYYTASYAPATISTQSAEIVSGTNAVTVTNSYNTGNLTVTKTVAGTYAPKEEQSETFNFTLTLKDNGSTVAPPITVNNQTVNWSDGVYVFTLKDGGSITIYGIPDGVTYTVTEVQPEGFDYTTKVNDVAGNTATGTANNDPTVTFTNTYKYSQLTITKNVSEDTPAGIAGQSFNITVTLHNNTGNYDYTSSNGTSGKVPSDGKLTIKDGEAITIDKVPIGETYSVTEDDLTYFDEKVEPNSGTIVDAGNTVAITNTYKPGKLTISKTVFGTTAPKGQKSEEFAFVVTLTDEKGAKVSGTFAYNKGADTASLPFTEGSAEIKLKDGESITFTNLPQGVGYKVEETDDNVSAKYTPTSNGEEGTISETDSNAAFTNTYKFNDLTISKIVENKSAALYEAPAVEFPFVLVLKDANGNPLTGKYQVKDSDKEIELGTPFNLMAGESITIQDLPVGATYTVTENAVEGFVLGSKTGDTGSIEANQEYKATFTNGYHVGQLKISKRVEGADAPKDAEGNYSDVFTFNVSLKDATGTAMTGYTYKIGENGEAKKLTESIELKDGQTAIIDKLPAGTTYVITESHPDYTTKVGEPETNTATGTIVADSSSQVEFTNTYKYSHLTIKKTGMKADTESAIFTVSNGKDKTFTVVVPNGDFVTIGKLEIGDTYTIKESGSWTWLYTPSISPSSVKITEGGNTVTVTNSGTDKWLHDESGVINTYGIPGGNPIN